MIEPKPIETAPKDGTEIFAYDGKWWRDDVRWQRSPVHGGAFAWYFQGHLRIEPVQWFPLNVDYEELWKEVAKGYARA